MLRDWSFYAFAVYEALLVCVVFGLACVFLPQHVVTVFAPRHQRVDDLHLILIRLFGIALIPFGGLLHVFYMRGSTAVRAGILRILLMGDACHVYSIYAHRHSDFWTQFEIGANLFGTMSLVLARVVFFVQNWAELTGEAPTQSRLNDKQALPSSSSSPQHHPQRQSLQKKKQVSPSPKGRPRRDASPAEKKKSG